jgi:hypothetical protein
MTAAGASVTGMFSSAVPCRIITGTPMTPMSGIMEARERRKKTTLSEYERHRLAMILDLLGGVRGDDAWFQR